MSGERKELPVLEELLNHLARCPGEFLGSPLLLREKRPRPSRMFPLPASHNGVGAREAAKFPLSGGGINVAAVVSDMLVALGGEPVDGDTAVFFLKGGTGRKNLLRCVLAACWLFGHEWFRKRKGLADKARRFLVERLERTAELVAADLFVSDPDRREELVRLALSALDLRPRGESAAEASDRLETLDSVKRDRVIRKAREAEEKARKLREAMARKRAMEEAAARYNRE